MKKKLLALACCLSLGFTQAQNLLNNGDFESYNTLPTTCPTLPSSNPSTISDLNNWSVNTQMYHWDPGQGCQVAGNCTNTAVYGGSYYYNSTTGGNGSCEPFAAQSGTGYVISQNHGVFWPDPYSCHNGAAQYLLVSLISGTTLYASNNYTFQGYVYVGTVSGAAFGCEYLTAELTTGTNIPAGTSPNISVTGSGWVAFSVTLTVPSNGSYALIIGPPMGCQHDPGYYYYALDNLSLTEAPCVGGAGSNKTNTPECCGTPCPGVGVQIGTTGLSGLSYSWTCSAAPNCYISNTTAATPTVSPCSAPSTTIYSVTVSGPGCITSTYSMSVATHTVGNCCRMADPETSEKDTEGKLSHFTVFPNPASNEVTLSLSKSLDYLKIVDASGKIVYETKDVGVGDLKIDLSRYAKGIYFIIGKNEEETERQKFIIE